MGRKRKYYTEKERRNAQRRWSREYYYRNREKINKKYMERYYERKTSGSLGKEMSQM